MLIHKHNGVCTCAMDVLKCFTQISLPFYMEKNSVKIPKRKQNHLIGSEFFSPTDFFSDNTYYRKVGPSGTKKSDFSRNHPVNIVPESSPHYYTIHFAIAHAIHFTCSL